MQQDPALVAKRQAEHDACTHVSQLNALYARWHDEDAAAADRLAALKRKSTQRPPAYDAESNDRLIVEAVGRFIGKHLDDLSREIRELQRELEERKRRLVVHDAGIWRDDCGYEAGSLVTFNGGGWIAQRDTTAGERPGTSPGFRLAFKSDLAEVRKVVKQELAKGPTLR
jgi:hypothetical protein